MKFIDVLGKVLLHSFVLWSKWWINHIPFLFYLQYFCWRDIPHLIKLILEKNPTQQGKIKEKKRRKSTKVEEANLQREARVNPTIILEVERKKNLVTYESKTSVRERWITWYKISQFIFVGEWTPPPENREAPLCEFGRGQRVRFENLVSETVWSWEG